MKMSKYEQDTDQILTEYAESFNAEMAAEMDKYLTMDENAEENFERYGKRKYINPRKKVFRYAAIFIVAAFIGSIVIPIPQASAWQLWWLDLIFGENEEDIDVLPDNEDEFIEFYVDKIPEGFELIDEQKISSSEYVANYISNTEKYIIFIQSDKNEATLHLDNEKHNMYTDVIGEFEVLISEGRTDIIFCITAEKSNISIQTNAPYEVGKEFILGLKKIN